MKQRLSFLLLLTFTSLGLCLTSAAQLIPAPTLLSPPNNSQMPIDQAVEPVRFEWDASEGAVSYEVNLLVRRPNQNPFPMQRTGIQDTFVEIDLGLSLEDTNTRVTWTVRALTEDNFAVSQSFSFTTVPTIVPTPTPNPFGLPAPELIAPEDEAMFSLEEALGNGVGGIEFDWNGVSGAASYVLLIYRDNDDFIRRPTNNTSSIEQISTNIEDIFQWEVRAVDTEGKQGQAGPRRSFAVSSPQILPSPTPFPVTPDMNSNGTLTAEDVYRFAKGFFTNDPRVDFNHSGLNDAEDILLFVEQYQDQK